MTILLAFATAFFLAWRQDSGQASVSSRRLATQLELLVRAGDDIAIIDTVKALGEYSHILAVRVKSNDKDVANAGDVTTLPFDIPFGVTYRFPSTWISRIRLDTEAAGHELLMLERSSPGPLLWGLLAALAVLAGAYPFWRQPSPAKLQPSLATEPASNQTENIPSSADLLRSVLDHLALRSKERVLCLDDKYVVLWASPDAGALFQRPSGELQGLHLIDLTPAPDLVSAIEEGKSGPVNKPFQDKPISRAEIQQTKFGFLIQLHP